jgi:hypothetical protein
MIGPYQVAIFDTQGYGDVEAGSQFEEPAEQFGGDRLHCRLHQQDRIERYLVAAVAEHPHPFDHRGYDFVNGYVGEVGVADMGMVPVEFRQATDLRIVCGDDH